MHLAAVDAVSGMPLLGWAAGTDGPVSTLASAGGRVFAGGTFKTADGAPRGGLAGFDAATGALSVLDVPVHGPLATLAADGTRLYLGGSFDRVGGKRHPALAAIDLGANALVRDFNAPRTPRRASFRYANVRTLAPHGARILVGGDVSVSRTTGPKARRRTEFRNGLIAVRATDATVDYAFDAHVNGTVQALVRSAGTVYVGGSMSRRSGTKVVRLKPRNGHRRSRKIALFRYNLVALDAATGALRRPFQPAPKGDVGALALSASQLYVAGRFQIIGGRRRDGLAAVDPATGRPATLFSPEPMGAERGVTAMLADGARLYAGGDFSGFGLVPRANFAIFATPEAQR
jgi:hypothetical protein